MSIGYRGRETSSIYNHVFGTWGIFHAVKEWHYDTTIPGEYRR